VIVFENGSSLRFVVTGVFLENSSKASDIRDQLQRVVLQDAPLLRDVRRRRRRFGVGNGRLLLKTKRSIALTIHINRELKS
jgi:hypothetical protein